MKIIPIQIVEELKRTSIEEISTTYIAIFPDAKRTRFDIQNYEQDLFTSVESVRKHMLTNVQRAIEKIVNTAVQLKQNAFDTNEKENNVNQDEVNMQADVNNDIIMVDLGNGTKAKIKKKNMEEVVGK